MELHDEPQEAFDQPAPASPDAPACPARLRSRRDREPGRGGTCGEGAAVRRLTYRTSDAGVAVDPGMPGKVGDSQLRPLLAAVDSGAVVTGASLIGAPR